VKNIELLSACVLTCAIQSWGCTTDVTPLPSEERGCYIGEPNCIPKPGTSPAASPSTSGGISTGGAASPAPSGATPPSTNALPSGVPCDVAQVVGSRCVQCHAEQPKFGASMPLTKLADFHAPAKSDPRRKVYEVIPERINAQDATRLMPPASSTQLVAAELRTLNDWIGAGAKASSSQAACNPPAAGTPDPTGAATTSVMPIEYNDPEMKCYRFTAHAPGDKMTPFTVETTPDMYKGFTFMPPWQGMMYARSFKAVIDNEDVIHHWLFFRNGSAGQDGQISDQLGAHPDGNLVHGWAPGGDDLYLQPDVGEEMPGNVSYMLETHYNNTGGSAAPDASGVEVCVTPKPPAKVASISWLGTDLIAGPTATGTCDPSSTQPITIIGGTPHMHLKGRHMKVVINRANGSKETLTDRPFDFQYQLSYLFNQVMVMPGDTITTTCTYSEPATYGKGTNDEMCYLFTLYYPKLALTNGDLLGSSLHGPDTCLGSAGGDLFGGGGTSDDPAKNLIPGVDIPFLPGI